MTLFTDSVESGLERALDALSLRQQVTAQNIANAMTPGYHAQRVDFEGDLAAAMNSGDPSSAPITVTDAGGVPRADGNTVEMEQQMTTLVRTGLQYQAAVEAVNYKFGVLRTAIEGR